MTWEQQRKAQVALAYFIEKKTGKIKGHVVYNGASTRNA